MFNLLKIRNPKSTLSVVMAAAVMAALLTWILTYGDVARLQAQTPDDGAPRYANMDPFLNEIVAQHETGQFTVNAATANASVSGGESVGVIFLTEPGQSSELRDFLQQNGAAPGPAFDGFIGADVPVNLLAEASQQDGVTWMQASIPPAISPPSLSITAQANPPANTSPLHGADVWHQAGVKGEGVKIGIVSHGFEGFQNNMGTTLPASVDVRCYIGHGIFTSDFDDCTSPFHNRELGYATIAAEAIFSIAPEATYYIAHIDDRVDFWDSVRWMIDNDVDVIRSGVSWVWTGPGDGTSPLTLSDLNVVDEAVDNGITWVMAAGNDAKSTWFGEFDDTDGNGFHNFAADDADECNAVTIGSMDFFFVLLRWEGDWSGTADPSSAAELNVYLVNEDTSALVGRSFRPHWAADAGMPLEYLYFVNRSASEETYCLSVELSEGEAPNWLQLQAFYGEELEHHTSRGSISSPAESASPGAIAVGVASLNDPEVIWEHSSRGPTPDGRIKPDIVGGQHEDEAETHGLEDQEYTPGTAHESAHVAGLAALVKQRFPDFSPEEIADYLKTNAEDRGEPGPDNTWGYGFAKLPASDAAAPPDPDVCLQRIYGDQRIQGTWNDSCLSENRHDEDDPDDAIYYARYFTIAVGEGRRVTINLTSDLVDPYLYLLDGEGRDGEIERENDDIEEHIDLNSRIVADGLPAGRYTIEATTYSPGTGGDFTLTVRFTDADQVAPSQPEPPPSPAGPFTAFSRGTDHVCALRSNGTAACWGDDRHGQASPPAGRYTAISSGEHGACALRNDGAVACWGSFDISPATDDNATGPFTEVSRGSDHACALDSDGAITCWGGNRHGQRTPPAGEFTAIHSHDGGSCALRDDNALVCWGSFEVSP